MKVFCILVVAISLFFNPILAEALSCTLSIESQTSREVVLEYEMSRDVTVAVLEGYGISVGDGKQEFPKTSRSQTFILQVKDKNGNIQSCRTTAK